MRMILLLCLVGFVAASSLSAFADDLSTEKELSTDYLIKVAAEPNAKVIEKGIILRPIFESGSQKFSVLTDTVKVAYHLVDREGKVVDESITADEVVSFPLNNLIKCWQIAIPKISLGSFYKVSCPSDVAYGDKGMGNGSIKGGAALTFRIQVFGVELLP